jgi:predicted aconitase
MRSFAALMADRRKDAEVSVIATVGRATYAAAEREGLVTRLEEAGVQILRDLCWCSITEPVLPPSARVLMTNSGKYAHYAPGLCGREVRFGSLRDCAMAAQTGAAPVNPPEWLGQRLDGARPEC